MDCPYCNKKIKISAEKCRFCRYDVKKYYEEKMQEYSQNPYYNLLYKTDYDLKPPKKIQGEAKVFLIITLIIVGFFIILGILFRNLEGTINGLKMSFPGWGLCLLFFILSYNSNAKYYDEHVEAFELYQKDPKYYKTIRIEQDIKRNKKEAFLVSQKPTITCPYCKSTNVKKITTTSRVIGAATMGLASSNIGNQWYCNNCKSKF